MLMCVTTLFLGSRCQTEETIIPGAYIVLLVMEKLPGVPLWEFWSREPEQRRRIREGFREALR